MSRRSQMAEERILELVVSDKGDIFIDSVEIHAGETLRECLIRHGYGDYLLIDPDMDNPKGPSTSTIRLRRK
jgi:hypothetical protein